MYNVRIRRSYPTWTNYTILVKLLEQGVECKNILILDSAKSLQGEEAFLTCNHSQLEDSMTIMPDTDRDLDLWVWLSRTRDAVFKARMRELHKHKITGRQASAMFVIQALGDRATPAEISRWLFREPHSVSEFLNRMERDGLIKKAKDQKRKNVIRVKLTERGLKAHQKTTELESIHNIMSILSDKEGQQLKALLRKLWYGALEELGMPRRLPFPPLKRDAAV